MKTLKELQPVIVEWAKERNIHLPECAPKQRLKLIEEVGELASAILKNDIDKQKDAIGDIFVVLVILAEQVGKKLNLDMFIEYDFDINVHEILFQILYNCSGDSEDKNLDFSTDFLNDTALNLNLDLTECANLAYNEIKDRKGKTVNGTFLKEEV